MRIGIYGGTFNPPHIGHLLIAQHILNEFKLDLIYFIPAFRTDYKKDPLNKEARMKMLKGLIRGNNRFRVSGIELEAGGISHTIDTLKKFCSPSHRYFLIMGNEWLGKFNRWKDYKEIFRYAGVIVARRLDIPEILPVFLRPFRKKVLFSSNPLLEISSSCIRDMRKKGMDIQYLVTPAVDRLIRQNRLYIS